MLNHLWCATSVAIQKKIARMETLETDITRNADIVVMDTPWTSGQYTDAKTINQQRRNCRMTTCLKRVAGVGSSRCAFQISRPNRSG